MKNLEIRLKLMGLVLICSLTLLSLPFARTFAADDSDSLERNFDFSNLAKNVDAAKQMFDCLNGNPPAGDVNSSCAVDSADFTYLTTYLLEGGPPPVKLKTADVNGDCEINLADAVYLARFVFAGGPPPRPSCLK